MEPVWQAGVGTSRSSCGSIDELILEDLLSVTIEASWLSPTFSSRMTANRCVLSSFFSS